MKTNLLKITKLPSALYTLELNLTYPEVIQLFKSKPIYFHLHRNKLYFVGNPELVKVALGNEDVEIDKIETDSAFVMNNWGVILVLLYKILRFFLYKHGFGFHASFLVSLHEDRGFLSLSSLAEHLFRISSMF